MTDETVTLHRYDERPERCPKCGREYTRTWTNDARPLGGPYRRFEHETNHQTEYCLVPITETDA